MDVRTHMNIGNETCIGLTQRKCLSKFVCVEFDQTALISVNSFMYYWVFFHFCSEGHVIA